MRFALTFAIVSLIALSCRSVVQTADNEQVKMELAALERRLIAAVQRKDMAALGEIWDDDYFGTAPNGVTVRKKDLMEAVNDGVIVIDSIEPDDLLVRQFGDVAVMTGKADVIAKVVEEEVRMSVRGTGIFVRRDGKWKIAGVHVGPNAPDMPMKPENKK
jgi:ketosteroid isomerase-like protein